MLTLMTTDTVGGVWTYSLQLADALSAQGVTVHLATMGPPMDVAQRRQLAASAVAEVHESTYALEWMASPWEDVGTAGHWLVDLERKVRPDVVHLNGFAHGALPWRAPTVMVAHSCVLSWWQAVHGLPAPAAEWSVYAQKVREGLDAAGAVVAPSMAMAKALQDCYGPRAVRVVPNGRTDEWYVAVPKEPLVLAGGRAWDAAKNLLLLDQIAPRLAWPVVVAGSRNPPDRGRAGPLEPASGEGHEKKAPQYLGSLRFEHLAQWLRRASVYVSPALYEPFGLGVLEAAQAGCALVLSDIESFHELWGDAALYVNPRSPDRWARTLSDLCSQPQRLAQLGRAARRRASFYRPAAMAACYLSLYRALEKSIA